jgi:hypothetical protein
VNAMSTQLGHVAIYLNDYLGTDALWEERPSALRIARPEQDVVPGGTATRLARPALEPDRPKARRSLSSRASRTEAPSAPPEVKAVGRKRLSAIAFPAAAAAVARCLIRASQSQARLLTSQAGSTSLARLRSFDQRDQAADVAAAAEANLLRKALHLPAPSG